MIQIQSLRAEFLKVYLHIANGMLFAKAGGRTEFISFELKTPSVGFQVDQFIITMADHPHV